MHNQPGTSGASAAGGGPPLSPAGRTSHSRHTSASSTNSSSSSHNNRLSIAERNQAFLDSLDRARDDKVQRNLDTLSLFSPVKTNQPSGWLV